MKEGGWYKAPMAALNYAEYCKEGPIFSKGSLTAVGQIQTS